MSIPVNLNELLHGKPVEWERLEFKKGWNPQAVLHTLCAFANDFHNLGGGYIIIGVAESDGLPVLPPGGLEPHMLDSIQKEILNLGFHSIQPSYHPLIYPEVIGGSHILVIHAPGGQTRPYKAKKELSPDCKEWPFFIRKASNTVRARGEDERELMSLAANVPFDDRINQHASINDLSRDLIVAFLEEIGSDLATQAASMPLVDLARQLELVGGPPEACFPRNVGLLFFNHNPHSFFPLTQIDVVWFPDGAGGDTISEKTFKGPLPHMMREALQFIHRNYISEIVIKVAGRAEARRVENFPFAAVEEILANAVYHRSYEQREPIEVRISPQDFVILSHPGPDRSIRLDQLTVGRAVSRRYRNRRIGDFLKELDFTEGRSTGIPKVIRSMSENGSPAAEFDFNEDHSYFLVRLPVHPAATQYQSQVVGGASEEIPPRVEQLLRILRGEKTRSDMMKELGFREGGAYSGETDFKVGETFRELYLAPALKFKLIEMVLVGRAKNQVRKYRVTTSGAAWLATRPKPKDSATTIFHQQPVDESQPDKPRSRAAKPIFSKPADKQNTDNQ